MRLLALLPFLSLTLAQVGLLDGPRPSTEVRGYLEGNAQEGYRVRVEFLLETGTNPVQGTSYQSLTWNGRLYLCVGGCDTFTLSGFSPGTYPNGQAYNLYDSQGKLRGRAGVTTEYYNNQPYRYRVEYAVWPLSGTKTWQASPDNPVPMETGGWLTARPPGGSPERYRYPGMESYRPPSGGSIFAGISPQDRDLAQKSLIDSMAKLRAFFGRLVRGSELWFFVPEVTPWTFQLAQEFQARVGGPVRFVVPEGTALSYCPTGYRSDPRFHVLPRPSLDKKDALAVIWPPQNASQKGAAMAGRFLVDRPDWPETDYVSFTTPLLPTVEGLPEARADVWGYISQANLRARVWFREWTIASRYTTSFSFSRDSSWDGTFTHRGARGEEGFRLANYPPPSGASSATLGVRDTADRDRGVAYLEIQREVAGYEVDTSRPQSVRTTVYANPVEGITFTWDGEDFVTYNCAYSRTVRWTRIYACRFKDSGGRDRGYGEVGAYYSQRNIGGVIYPLKPLYRVTGYRVTVYLRDWVQVDRAASDNDRPVEAGGHVTAEGKRYRIPGLEGYLSPTGKEIEAVEGDPYVTYLTRSLLPDRNPYAALNREEGKVWYKPLSQWCQERGK